MLAAITIDVDSLRFYGAIHGLGHDALGLEDDPIYSVALPRFFELLSDAGVPATLFAIGQDAGQRPEAFAPLGALGCEVASHSFAHDYRLTRRSPAAIEADLAQAEAALVPLSPAGEVVGFRAPGYNVSPSLMHVLVRRGYRYDSSLLPAPAYWAARGVAIARYKAVGRPSASIVGDPRQFAGPLIPYAFAPDRCWRPNPDGPLVEVPMAVHPWTRWPLIGTSWVLMPDGLRQRALAQTLARRWVFNFEMHAIDLLDATDRGIPRAIAAAQPDLRVSVRDKMSAFLMLFRRLANARAVRTLAQIAESFPETP